MEYPSCQHIEQYLVPGKRCHLVGIGGVSMRPLGLVLRRMGMEVSGSDMNASVSTDELIAKGIHISPYEQGNIFNKDPRRPRRLLAHKAEIRRLGQQIKLQGYTLVPLSLYFKKGRVKLELGLCKGKKLYDKRASAAARDAKRDIDRALKTQR